MCSLLILTHLMVCVLQIRLLFYTAFHGNFGIYRGWGVSWTGVQVHVTFPCLYLSDMSNAKTQRQKMKGKAQMGPLIPACLVSGLCLLPFPEEPLCW